MRNTLAVIDDTHFYIVGRKWQHTVTGLASLLEQAETAKLTHVWIVKNSQLSHDCSVSAHPNGWSVRTMQTGQRVAYCSAIRSGAAFEMRIQIGFSEYAPWPWDGCESPKTLLATLAYLEEALQLPLEWTPAHMAIDVIRQQNAERWSWLAPMTMDLEKAPGFRYGLACKEITNWRGIEQVGKYRLTIDGNSDYGAAMTGLNVGEGNPVWIKSSEVAQSYDGKRPGFWNVESEPGASLFDGTQLPSFEDYPWLTTDLVEQLRREGYQITIKKGWCWRSYHQTLRSTISNKAKSGLWDLRLAWRIVSKKSAAHENVYESISSILHTVHGKLGDDDLTQKRFFRPDMYAMVVAKAVGRRVYHIMKIHRLFGVLPVRIHIDGLEYVVDDPHIFDSMLDKNKLGGFKLVKTVEIS